MVDAHCRLCRHIQPFTSTAATCAACGGRQWLCHRELDQLTIAHIDCDAFYANVEKREHPEWRDKPLIVGGRQRGVVTTACYIARMFGVRSAMPMFEARARCPHALIVKPRMALYRDVGLEIRKAMRRLSPKIQPVSIDEAYVDLSDTQRLHGKPAFEVLMDFQDWVAEHLGLSLSIGLAHNKLLAKIASDLEKPRGFSVLGPSDGQAFLADKPVRILWGIGPSLASSLSRRGILKVGDLARFSEAELSRLFGSMGPRLAAYAQAEDPRKVRSREPTKSISAETTFYTDLSALEDLYPNLKRLAGRVASRAQRSSQAGWVVTIKLKTEDFQTFTRRQKLPQPTFDESTLLAMGETLLKREMGRGPFRLLGLGLSDFSDHGVEKTAAEASVLLKAPEPAWPPADQS